MAEQSRTDKLACSINAALSRVKRANARLDAGCTSTLLISDLAAAGYVEPGHAYRPGLRDTETVLQPVFDISESLANASQ